MIRKSTKQSKKPVDGFSHEVRARAKELEKALKLPSATRPKFSTDLLPFKDERISEMTSDQIALSVYLKSEAADSVILYHLAEANADPSEVERFFHSVSIDVVNALEHYETLADERQRNPLIENHEDAVEIIVRAKALRRKLPKDLKRRASLGCLVAGTENFFDTIEHDLNKVITQLEFANVDSVKKRRTKHSPLLFVVTRDIDWLTGHYFKKRIEKREAFVLRILKLASLSFIADYDSNLIGRPTYRSIRRWKNQK